MVLLLLLSGTGKLVSAYDAGLGNQSSNNPILVAKCTAIFSNE